MPALILHHFDASPFAEKVRVALGIKRLEWASVQIPMIMPKPDLMPLSGGYRKTPVLQVGAEVYCDTALILDELERLHPEPPLFPPDVAGLAPAMSRWSDTSFFEPGAGLSMGLNPDLPEPILADRKQFFEFMDFDELASSVPHLMDQFFAEVAKVEAQLSDGRAFWLGDAVTALDIFAYFPLWMARANVPGAIELLKPFAHTERWTQRVADIGSGQSQALKGSAALDIARASEPKAGRGVVASHTHFSAYDTVTVTPTDYGAVPVTGTLITLDHARISLRRVTPQTGPINTHFPRAGYRLDPA
ncbi:MAG: glutathione S-transferase family protein [Gammaproteobacteria bacterium]